MALVTEIREARISACYNVTLRCFRFRDYEECYLMAYDAVYLSGRV